MIVVLRCFVAPMVYCKGMDELSYVLIVPPGESQELRENLRSMNIAIKPWECY